MESANIFTQILNEDGCQNDRSHWGVAILQAVGWRRLSPPRGASWEPTSRGVELRRVTIDTIGGLVAPIQRYIAETGQSLRKDNDIQVDTLNSTSCC